MAVNFAMPSLTLIPYIKRFWAIDNTLPKGERCVQRIVPTGFGELLLYFSDTPKIINVSDKHITDNIALYGHHSGYYDIEYHDNISVFSIVFEPQGLSQFFRFSVGEISNLNVPLRFLIGKSVNELEETMATAASFEERIKLVETYFLNLLTRNYKDFEFRRMNHVIRLIKNEKGIINIDKMASEACVSRRQFERLFTQQIGQSPKQYLKTIRFQAAIANKQHNNALNMTELAYESGYYDQSHFINEFRTLCGQTPKQYFEENEACSDFF